MQRRNFVKSSLIGATAVSSGFVSHHDQKAESEKEVYELRKYEMVRNNRQNDLDRYLKEALIPALNRFGIKNIGCFVPLGKAEPAVVYVLIPYPSAGEFIRIAQDLPRDSQFLKDSAFYDNQPADNPVFSRFTSSLLLAFDGFSYTTGS